MMNRRPFIVAVLLPAWCTLALAVAYVAAGSKTSPRDSNGAVVQAEAVQYRYKVIASYPHDRRAFTQGLVYENGVLYEGTGLYGQSTLAKRDLKTGAALKTVHLARRHFGEGITIFGDRIIQLTWKNNTGFVYRKDTFTLLREFTYRTEGWGITHDGKRLIYSDGTATLRFLDPNTFIETSRIEVRDGGRPVRGLNELEFINGSVFANVWPTDQIVVIDPKTGRVTGRLDLSTLHPRPDDSEDVLNGIAWIPETNHLLVTGKLWPKLYEIEIGPQPSTNVSFLPAALPSIASVDIFSASNDELDDGLYDKQRGELNEQRRELAKWFRDQYTKIDDVFESSLKLKKADREAFPFPLASGSTATILRGDG